MMPVMALIALALTHFLGQMNLLAPTWLWLAAFVGYGVMSTPGEVIDGKRVHAGGVPDRKKIETWLGCWLG